MEDKKPEKEPQNFNFSSKRLSMPSTSKNKIITFYKRERQSSVVSDSSGKGFPVSMKGKLPYSILGAKQQHQKKVSQKRMVSY